MSAAAARSPAPTRSARVRPTDARLAWLALGYADRDVTLLLTLQQWPADESQPVKMIGQVCRRQEAAQRGVPVERVRGWGRNSTRTRLMRLEREAPDVLTVLRDQRDETGTRALYAVDGMFITSRPQIANRYIVTAPAEVARWHEPCAPPPIQRRAPYVRSSSFVEEQEQEPAADAAIETFEDGQQRDGQEATPVAKAMAWKELPRFAWLLRGLSHAEACATVWRLLRRVHRDLPGAPAAVAEFLTQHQLPLIGLARPAPPPAPPVEPEEPPSVWAEVVGQLLLPLGRWDRDTWFRLPTRLVADRGAVVEVAAPALVIAQIHRRFTAQLHDAIARVRPGAAVQFIAEEAEG